jgi:virulence-associated protein VagC
MWIEKFAYNQYAYSKKLVEVSYCMTGIFDEYKSKTVKISKQGNKIILEPIENAWELWISTLGEFSDDFMQNGRAQPPVQERDWN